MQEINKFRYFLKLTLILSKPQEDVSFNQNQNIYEKEMWKWIN